MKIFISSTADALRNALSGFALTATVEAEFGSDVVEGSTPSLTLAHHGDRASNPPVCVGGRWGKELLRDTWGCRQCGGYLFRDTGGNCLDCGGDTAFSPALGAIGLSHIDLDALGGVMRLLDRMKPENGAFWDVVAQIDVRGPHHLEEILEKVVSLPWVEPGEGDGNTAFTDCFRQREEIQEALQAFWAWSEKNKLFPPRDGSALDVTVEVMVAIQFLDTLFEGDEDAELALKAGRAWAAAKEALATSSFVRTHGNNDGSVVLLRESEEFCNHLYSYPNGVAAAVVGFNPTRGTVTLSLANPVPGVSCCAIAQQLWGPNAGGHAGIAGSPREGGLTVADAGRAASVLADAITAAKNA